MKIGMVITDSYSAWHFRRGLIDALLKKGNDVYLLTPLGSHVDKLEALGAKHIKISVNRFMDPFGDVFFLYRLFRIFHKERFDVVHNFSIKPNTFGAIAAWTAGIKYIVSSITGLGLAFNEDKGLKARLRNLLVRIMYRIGFGLSKKVWCQNQDDIILLSNLGILDRRKAVLIRSSGVNLDDFDPISTDENKLNMIRKELFLFPGLKIAVMISRPLESKGVRNFVEASEILSSKIPNIRFLFVGDFENRNPDNIPKEYFAEKESKVFKFLGWRNDIREILALSNVVVLPSFYREGVPKSLIEALAMGKPIVTTDNVGCRETVVHEKNGYLIPPRDSNLLAEAIAKILLDEQLEKTFGKFSRKKAELEFSEDIVLKKMLKEVYMIK